MIPPEILKQLQDDTPADFYVDHENWPALVLFLDLETQWRYVSGMTIARVGLDYAAAHSVMQMRGIHNTSTMLDRLQLLEQGALAGINEDAKR